MKFKDSVNQALLNEVKSVQGGYEASFEEDDPPTAQIIAKTRGPWLWVSSKADYDGRTWDYTTDRLGGDPYSAHVNHDWVGKKDSAPKVVSHLNELNEWALLHTRYEREYTDVGVWGVHQDRWIEGVSKDGIVKAKVVSNRRFQDVSPVSETGSEQVDLSLFEGMSVDGLIGLLDNPNHFIREIAATLLGRFKDIRTVDPYLIQLTDDENKYVQESAILALGALGGISATRKLCTMLTESNYPLDCLTPALIAIGIPALDPLTPALESENSRISTAAVTIMKSNGGKKAIKILTKALDGTASTLNNKTIQIILTALGDLRATESLDSILRYLDDDDDGVQQTAAKALGELTDSRAIDSLVQSLLTAKHLARKNVADALSQLGWKPSTPEEESWLLFAKQEWENLIAMGDSAVETLICALNDDDSHYRGELLTPLSKSKVAFTEPRLADSILNIYKDKTQSEYRQREAIQALICIPIPSVVKFTIREYLKVDDDHLHSNLFKIITNFVKADVEIASKLISTLKRRKLDSLTKKKIEWYVKLFTVVPLSRDQLSSIKPWLESIDKRKIDDNSKEYISDLLKLDSLLPAFYEGDFSARESAVKKMNEVWLPSVIFPLMEALVDDHYSIRKNAVVAMNGLNEGSLPKVISALSNADYRVRMNAAESLGRMRFVESAEPLLKSLRDKNKYVRQNSAWALGSLRTYYEEYENLRSKIIKALTKVMKSDDFFPAQFNAVYALGQIEDEQATKVLLEVVTSPFMEFRLNATYGLIQGWQAITYESKIRNKIIDRLILTLSDDVDQVRYNAVDGLRLFMGTRALNALIALKDDKDPMMRELVKLGIKEIKHWGDRRRNTSSHTKRVHYELGDPTIIEELIPLFLDEDDDITRTTQIAIGEFGSLAFERMMGLLQNKDEHYKIRMGAAATLAEIGDTRATDLLIENLSDNHDDVRCNAAWALAELKNERSIKALVKATKDTNWQVRLNAIAGLGKMGGRAALNAILRLLEDGHHMVRVVATSYLHKFKSPRVLPALKSMVDDENAEVREIAKSWVDFLMKKK